MIATMSQQAPTMSLPASLPSAPKRPRLSLQIQSSPATTLKPGTALKAEVDPTSATAFNTLSNAYAAAIELSSPKVAAPAVRFDTTSSTNTVRKSGLRLVTNTASAKTPLFPSQHTQTPGAVNFAGPDTPTAAYSSISPSTAYPRLNIPSFTFTPPQSAHPSDESKSQVFSFTSRHSDNVPAMSPRTPRRCATMGAQRLPAPYTHPRFLHSILRNSPLPPKPTRTPVSPSRFSTRLADRAAKKLCFNNPLTQTITTERYIKSHIDLLAEEASPHSATESEAEGPGTLDLTMAYTGDETRDGGQTPGPFEEMRRRMAGLGSESDAETPGNKKRKRKEKKRRWVWTIGVNEEDLEDERSSPAVSSRSESPENPSLVERMVIDTQVQVSEQVLSSTVSFESQLPENPSFVENMMVETQAANSERAPSIKLQIPSVVRTEDPDTAVPLTAVQFPLEDVGKTPLTAIDLRRNLPKTPVTAIKEWAEAPKYSSVMMGIEEVAEPVPTLTIIIDSGDDREMVDGPSVSSYL